MSSAQYEFEQHYPDNGWVEHAPQDILDTVVRACRECLADSGLEVEQITCVGITNQRETTLVWDHQTGEAIYPAIVWQDRRTAKMRQQLKQDGHETLVTARTGLLLDLLRSCCDPLWFMYIN